MSLLINCQDLSKAYGSQTLFCDLSLSFFVGDRVGLIGCNGAGKSTFLKILANAESADGGEVAVKKGLKIGYVPQTSEFADRSPIEILLEQQPERYIAEKWLSKLGLDKQAQSAAKLSGGWKRRLAIAKAMVLEPDVLLLDEPTNHLDLDGVLWLEKFLKQEVTTFIAVSHDRCFLQNLTNRMVEIDPLYPEGLFAIEGDFSNFLEKKEQFIEGQLQKERSIASKARREEQWLRQNPKARTSKSRSRIDSAHEIFKEHADLKKRNRVQNVGIDFQASKRQTRKLLVAKNLQFSFNQAPIFTHLDLTLTPNSRLGLMGSNGAGKTTLLKLLSEELTPTLGTIKRADNLKIVYFDQHRAKLPDHLTLKEALAPNGEYVDFQGRPIHIHSWCKRFLFPPSFLGMQISKLSGGERARIAIAHLMLQPADLLLLDEPTNDLDIPTLQVLEDNLMEFSGAVVLITHDRYMLQRCCNRFLGLVSGQTPEIFEQYEEWERRRCAPLVPKKKKVGKKKPVSKNRSGQLEKKIAEEEKKLHLLTEQLESQNPEQLQELCQKIAKLEAQIESLYAEWAGL